MKRIFILIILTAALIGNVYSQTPDKRKSSVKLSQTETLINSEKQTWAFLIQKDYKGFDNLMAEDFYGIFPGRESMTKPQLLEFVTGFEIKSAQFSDFKVTMLDKNAAIITYQIDEQVIFQGKEFLNHNAVTSAWAKRGDKWLNVFFRPFILKSSVV